MRTHAGPKKRRPFAYLVHEDTAQSRKAEGIPSIDKVRPVCFKRCELPRFWRSLHTRGHRQNPVGSSRKPGASLFAAHFSAHS